MGCPLGYGAGKNTGLAELLDPLLNKILPGGRVSCPFQVVHLQTLSCAALHTFLLL